MDLIDAVASLADGSPIANLRRQRPEFVRHSQGSHDVLLAPADPGGLSLRERAAIAARVAAIDGDAALSAHYQSLGAGSESSPRLETILRHVELVTTAPGSATPAGLEALRAVGLASRDIVALTQIVAFVSYQVRASAGLRALAAEVSA